MQQNAQSKLHCVVYFKGNFEFSTPLIAEMAEEANCKVRETAKYGWNERKGMVRFLGEVSGDDLQKLPHPRF